MAPRGAAAYRCSSVMILGSWGGARAPRHKPLCKRLDLPVRRRRPLDPNSGRAFPFPLTPMLREDPGQELPLERLSELRKTVVLLLPERVCRDPVPIRTMVFPVYRRGCHTDFLPCCPRDCRAGAASKLSKFPESPGGRGAIRLRSGKESARFPPLLQRRQTRRRAHSTSA